MRLAVPAGSQKSTILTSDMSLIQNAKIMLEAESVNSNVTVACIWSITCLTKRAAVLINLSIAQHLTTYAIFGQSRSALATG